MNSLRLVELGYRYGSQNEATVLDLDKVEKDGQLYVRFVLDRNVGLGVCEFGHLDVEKAEELILYLRDYVKAAKKHVSIPDEKVDF